MWRAARHGAMTPDARRGVDWTKVLPELHLSKSVVSWHDRHHRPIAAPPRLRCDRVRWIHNSQESSMSRFSALIFAGALALSVAAPTLLAADKESPGVRNVVLVHGAWADASSCAKVIPLLEKAGLNVVAGAHSATFFPRELAT